MRILLCHDCGDDDVRRGKLQDLATGFLQEGHGVRITGDGWLSRRSAARRFKPNFSVAYLQPGRTAKWADCLVLDAAPGSGTPVRVWVLRDAVHVGSWLPPPFGPMEVAFEDTWRGQAHAIVAQCAGAGMEAAADLG